MSSCMGCRRGVCLLRRRGEMPVLRRIKLRRRTTAALEQWHFRATWAALRASMQYKRKILEMEGGGRRRPESSFSSRANAARAVAETWSDGSTVGSLPPSLHSGATSWWMSGCLDSRGGGRNFVFMPGSWHGQLDKGCPSEKIVGNGFSDGDWH
jgi:hypothetical protein